MVGTGHKPAILIVDDEERLRNALARSFRQEGYQTHVAGSGEEALRVLGREPVDLVITDLVMPGLDGLALVRALLTAAPGPPPKAILLTAYGSAESLAEAQALGVDGYLSKPFDLAQLKARVRTLVPSPAAGRGRGGGWVVRRGYGVCAAAGQAWGVLAGLPRRVWCCVQPRQVVFVTGRAVGAVAELWSGVRRRIAETR